jgi:uncharacterized membrane protein AbrB (regulator of aidB expression)
MSYLASIIPDWLLYAGNGLAMIAIGQSIRKKEGQSWKAFVIGGVVFTVVGILVFFRLV